ncbi:MAG: GNAT family N-acetyltransferase [Acidimicrobiales bacterium]
MDETRAEYRSGHDYLEAVTTLLRRVRNAHPTKGLFEAADMSWWWRTSRTTDTLPQLFWFDGDGRPEAAVIAIDWGGDVAIAPMLMPDAGPDGTAHVIERGLAHVAELGIERVDLEVDQEDTVMREILTGHGFATEEGESASVSVMESWLVSTSRPAVSHVHDGYRLATRLDTLNEPHHMIDRGGPDIEARLQETPLYRSDLDFVVRDGGGEEAARGIFWIDPETATGLVEPMRTQEGHQQKGLARHILTTGVNRLAELGADRIKVVFEPTNAAASALYLGAGFEPVKKTVVFSGGTARVSA